MTCSFRSQPAAVDTLVYAMVSLLLLVQLLLHGVDVGVFVGVGGGEVGRVGADVAVGIGSVAVFGVGLTAYRHRFHIGIYHIGPLVDRQPFQRWPLASSEPFNH